VVTEDTERVIGQRHIATLRDLGGAAGSVREEAEFLAAVAGHLERRRDSLPFSLVYLIDGDVARLAAHAGVAAGAPAAPALVELDGGGPWPIGDIATGDMVLVEDLAERFGELPTGVWDEPPTAAAVLPLPQQGRSGEPLGALVTAINRYRALDEDYRSFLTLVAGQLAAGIASARAYETERRRAEELAALDAAKTAFFTSVSHELRTPLTLMLGPAADALADADHPLAPPQRERVALIERNGERLLSLVNTLLDFSRLQSGRASAQFEAVDLAAYTAELAAMFRSPFARAGLTLEIAVEPIESAVYVDREMWAQVVLNLLSNGLKHTFEGGVTVALRERDGLVRLTVSDTGIGIEPAEQSQLFDRFHRVVGARSRSHEGSGIGLAIVAELVALHDGQVEVRSAPGQGSAFTVTIPAGAAHIPAEQIVDSGRELSIDQQARRFLLEADRWLEPHDGAGGGDQPDGRPRVLVADDNPDMRNYVTALLAGAYEAESASDGSEALERALERPPDLILSDVMMPRLDGFELVRALRADERTARIPVIILSARAGPESSVEGLEAGADDYLAKPFSAPELLARVRANISMARAREAAGERALAHARALEELSAAALRLVGEVEPATVVSRLAGEARALVAADGARVRAAGLEASAGTCAGAPVARIALAGGGELELHAPREPDVEERALLEQLGLVGTAVLRSAELHQRERATVEELQRSLLPRELEAVPGLEAAARYVASASPAGLGGDFYDVIARRDGRLGLLIGDVVGHGLAATATMNHLRNTAHAFAAEGLEPGELIGRMHQLVHATGTGFASTMAYHVLDPVGGALRYASAGHPPGLVLGAGGPGRYLEVAGSPPLGAGDIAIAPCHEDAIDHAETLLLFTDGLVERRHEPLDDGLARLLAAGEAGAGEPLEDLVSAVMARATDGYATADDIALLAVRRNGGGARLTLTLALDASSLAGLRVELRRWLAAVGAGEDEVADIVLAVSEGAMNAIEHSSATADLTVTGVALDGWVSIEIADGGRWHAPHGGRARGHGLTIMRSVMDDMRIDRAASGTTLQLRRRLERAA
jgi:signal transduction histidine kinase/serine phosphatase RsbU (regulator of sigma subunit)/CheY-like chemotaxis protein